MRPRGKGFGRFGIEKSKSSKAGLNPGQLAQRKGALLYEASRRQMDRYLKQRESADKETK